MCIIRSGEEKWLSEELVWIKTSVVSRNSWSMLKYNYTLLNLNAEVLSDKCDSYQRRTFKKKNCKGRKLKRKLHTLFVDQI